MTVTVMALLTIDDEQPVALAKYFEVTTPLLERAGARIIQRFKIHESIVGQEPSKMAVMVEYPSRDAIRVVFDSPEYQSIIPIRDLAFPRYSVSIVQDSEAASEAAQG